MIMIPGSKKGQKSVVSESWELIHRTASNRGISDMFGNNLHVCIHA